MTEITPDITRYEEPPELDDDEVEFWLRHPNGLQEADFDQSLHPRDRLGRWIRTFRLPTLVVGGAVRDSLLGKDINDVDLVSLATPEEIKAAVEETGHVAEELRVRDRLVGVRAHGPDLPPGGIEIAPPRIEKSTGPGRKDFKIVPHPQPHDPEVIHEDAVRRDFTVNALYRDPETGEITDPTGKGRADIEARLLRTTHADSFRDDPLRILRGARFASQHGLSPTPDTFDQMTEHADAMTALTQKGVSGTVEYELNKLLMGDEPGRGLRLLRDTGALAHLIPELGPMIGFDQESRWHAFTVDEHTFRVLDELAKAGAPVEVRIAALFHDSGKPESSWRGRDGRLHYYENKAEGKRDHAEIGAEIADSALRRLNYPADTRKRAKAIIANHMLTAAKEPTALKARKIRGRMGDELVRDVLIHRRADIASKGEDDDGLAARIDELADLVHQERDAPVFISDLKISGSDLIELGIKPGPEIGAILEDLRRQVVGSPERNDREWLLRQAEKAARKWVRQQDERERRWRKGESTVPIPEQ